jgi:hypothetical protein
MTNTSIPEKNQGFIHIDRVKLLDREKNPNTLTRAFVDLSIGPFLIHGFGVIQNKDGRGHFVVPPSQMKTDPKTGNTKNYQTVEVDRSFRERLNRSIVKAYLIERSRVNNSDADADGGEIPGDVPADDIPF